MISEFCCCELVGLGILLLLCIIVVFINFLFDICCLFIIKEEYIDV